MVRVIFNQKNQFGVAHCDYPNVNQKVAP